MGNETDIPGLTDIPVKFGDKAEVCASPAIILEVAEKLEEWIVRLAEQEEIDVERESIAMSQSLISFIVKRAKK